MCLQSHREDAHDHHVQEEADQGRSGQVNNIAAYRKLYGLSQRELALLLGYGGANPAAGICAWERGRVQTPEWASYRIAEIFDVPWPRLFGGPLPERPVPGQADRIREMLEELNKPKKSRRAPSRRTR